jgi:TonB-linked SusC/RagA family outer membrane protein
MNLSLRPPLWPFIPSNIKLAMKLCFIMMLLFNLQLTANTFAQKITLNIEEATLEEVFDKVNRQSGYAFFFDASYLKNAKPLSIKVKDLTLEATLQKIFVNQPFTYVIKGKTIIVKPRSTILPLVQQVINQKRIAGTVTDSLGIPLIGVGIKIKGTNITTTTDKDGKYTIDAPGQNSILVFSYIGYKTIELTVTGTTLNATMKMEETALNQVVVVGYGTQKKGSVTGSISQISSTEIMQSPIGNITGMITGKLPGLVSRQSSGLPGGDASSMTIRGPSSFASSNNPVVIVDGVRRSFEQLDPEEIETITILKDASSAAVYGLQAAAGVILVTTKKGKSGKPSIRFSNSVAMSENTMFPEFLNGPEYAYWYNKARMLNGKTPLFSNSDIRKILDGDPEGKWGNTNWVDELFQKGLTTHNGITVDGGNDGIKYFFFGGYYNQEGNVKNISFDRYNIRSNVDVKISNDLKVSIGLGAKKEKREAPTFSTGKNEWNNLFQQAMRAHPYLPKTYNGYPVGNRVNGPLVSPIAALEESGFRNNYTESFESNINLNWNLPWLAKGLSLNFLGSYDYRTTYAKAFQTPFKIAQGSVTAQGISYDIVESSIGSLAKLAENTSRRNMSTIQGSINYANTFGKHSFGGLLLYEQFRTLSNQFSISAQGLDFLELPELSFASEISPAAGSFSGGSNIVPNAGFVSRFNYAYDDKYLLEVSGRYDASYKFIREKRWTLFPAISLGWRLSEESFFKDKVSFVDNLKFRASVGRLGNDTGVNAYTFLSTMAPAAADASVVIGNGPQNAYVTNAISNPNLSWETVTIYNAGFESSLWRNLLGVEFDVFYKVTDDILESQGGTFPPSVGGYFPSVINTGKTDNRGFEIALTHSNSINEFNYRAKFNLSWYENRYLSVRDSPNIQDHLKRNGRKLDQKHGLVALGLFQTDEEARSWPSIFGDQKAGDIKYLDVNGDGKLTYQDDRMWIADSSVPQLMSSLSLSAEYKGFDFSLMFQGAAMAEYALSGSYPDIGYDNTEFTSPFFQLGNSPKYLVENSWTPDNRNAKYPRLSDIKVQNNKWASTLWIVNGDYLRLKTVQLGYTLPKKIVKNLGVKSLRLSASGGNLHTWTEFPYMDPEAPDVSNGFYPQQRTYLFGIDVKF